MQSNTRFIVKGEYSKRKLEYFKNFFRDEASIRIEEDPSSYPYMLKVTFIIDEEFNNDIAKKIGRTIDEVLLRINQIQVDFINLTKRKEEIEDIIEDYTSMMYDYKEGVDAY